MDRAKEEIAAAFGNNEDRYLEIFNIIDNRWDCQLHRPLYAAGYYLNPAYYYKNGEVEKDADKDYFSVSHGCHGTRRKKKEYTFFYKIAETFRNSYGNQDEEHLCTASLEKRNKLEQQKLNDLVYIKYNRALRRRYDCRATIDPIIPDETNVVDPTEWLAGIFDDEEGNAPVHHGYDLTWGDVERASGANKPSYSFRRSQDSCAKGGKGTKGSTSASKYNGKGKMQLIEVEDFDFDEAREEKKDVEAYKECDIDESDSEDDDFDINSLDD